MTNTITERAAVAAGLALALPLVVHASAMEAAGLKGKPPPDAGQLERFVDSIAENFVWIFATVAILAFLLVGGLFFFGHTRAQDWALKIGAGALIIVMAPGLAA